MVRKFTTLLLVVFALLIVAAPALAQGDAPSTDPVGLEDAFSQLVGVVKGFTFLFFAAPLVTMITSIGKIFIPDNISANTIALVVQVVIWIAYVVVNQLGHGEQFENVIDIGTRILEILLPFIVSALASAGLYHASSRANVAVIGYTRS